MRPVKSLDINYLQMRARSGATLHDCKVDAVTLALEHKCNVQFTLCTGAFFVNYKDLLKLVQEDV